MAKFTKSILKIGRKVSPDGEVVITPARLKHWENQFKALKTAGAHIPMHWDHSADPAKLKALSASEYKKERSSKNTIGEMVGFKVAEDGKSAVVSLDITDDDAKKKAGKNKVYISPVLADSFKFADGKEYPDAIIVVDVVNHPVDHDQGPFVEVANAAPGTIACCLRMGLSTSVYRMAADDKPFEKKDDGDDSDSDSDAGDDATDTDDDGTPDVADPAPANPDMPATADDGSKTEALIACVSQLGGELPSDFSLSSPHALDLLLTVFKTLAKSKSTPDADDDADDQQGAGGQSQVKVTDPGGFQGMSLDPRTKAAIAYAERQHQASVKTRLTALRDSGRCTPAEFAAKEPAVNVIKLSLDDSGKPDPSKLEDWLDSREAVPAGTFWDDATRTANVQKLSLSPIPAHASGQAETEEEAEATVDRMYGRKKK